MMIIEFYKMYSNLIKEDYISMLMEASMKNQLPFDITWSLILLLNKGET